MNRNNHNNHNNRHTLVLQPTATKQTERELQVIDLLADVMLARWLNPRDVKKLCKTAQKKCKNPVDRRTFLMIRKSHDPLVMVDNIIRDLMPLIDSILEDNQGATHV